MSAIRPHGVAAAAMTAALNAMRDAVGRDFMFAEGNPRFDSYDDAFPIDDPGRFAPAAAIAPDGIEQIRAVLKIASQYRIPLWTFSTGRNFAYGGASPRVRGSVIVDLSRMDRILEVDEKSAYCVVEPGVTYFQLYEYLRQKRIKLWLSPPEPGWASVMGNALEHGVGYTPMGDNFGFSCGMELVLADGDIVRTGMGAMAKSNSWHVFKYGFGPTLDGMFSQSNFGIVTKLGMWLMPEPPAYRSYMISFPRESDLHQVIEILRPLKIAQIVQNCGMVVPWTYEATLTFTRAELHEGQGRIPDAGKRAIIDKLDIGFWNFYGAQYGTPAMMDEQWEIISAAFSHVPGARFHFAEDRPELIGVQLRDLLGRGQPNMATFNVLNWVPNAGHVDFSSVSPSTGEDATRLYELLRDAAQAADLDYVGAFIIGWREMHNVLLMIYDKTDAAERAKIRALFSQLVQTASAYGYGEYRTHLGFMDQVAKSYDFNDNAMLRLCERIKDALDPAGILSPGKSGIWPRDRRRLQA